MKKNIIIIPIIITMIIITFSCNYISYAAAGDHDKIIEKYLRNEELTQEEVNELKNDTITSTFYDASVIEMAKEAANNGTIKVKNSGNGSSASNGNTGSGNTGSSNTSKGTKYWHNNSIQTLLDQYKDYRAFSDSDIMALEGYFSNATSGDIKALESSDINDITNVIKGIQNSPNLKQMDPSIAKSLKSFCAKLQGVATGSQKSTLKDLESKLGDTQKTAEDEKHNQEVINDPNKGSVDPGDIRGDNGGSTSKPSTGALGTSSASAEHTLGEITSEAKGFLQKGTVAIPFNEGNLKNASDTLFNILLGLATAAVVIIGVYLGVKFMMSTVEDKAKVKESLIPYIAGCVVVFGAFTIWKLALLLLENIG